MLIRMDICDMIAADGHQVEEAGSGEQAIEMLQGGHFDFLVTDLGLPGEWRDTGGQGKGDASASWDYHSERSA